jgi:DNA-binding LytR/AlgR family response regulator
MEAITLLRQRAAEFDITFVAIDVPGDMDGFVLAHWIREHAPATRVLLSATVEKAAKLASNLCESGPHVRKPYEPQSLLDWIKRLRGPISS